MSHRQTLVLLPGMLCDAALWRHQVNTLDDVADIHVGDLTRHDSIGAMAQAVLEAVTGPFALAGLSMGGYVAFEILRRAPERVTRVALLDTAAHGEPTEGRRRRAALIDLSRQGRFKGVTPHLLPSLVHPRHENDPTVRDTVLTMAERVGHAAFERQQRAIMNRPDSTADLPGITRPALVLCGREDAVTPLAVHEEMAAALPRAFLVPVEDCGHLAPLEQPAAVSAALRLWLQVS